MADLREAPRTYVVTGAGSGIGRALRDRLALQGDRVVGVDLRNADLVCDLSDPRARRGVVDEIAELTGGVVDGVAAVAGITAPIPATAAVNYFGAVDLLEGLRPLLERSSAPRAAVVSSIAAIDATDEQLVAALEAGDEPAALARAGDMAGEESQGAPIYASSKFAVARWVRRMAATAPWAGSGIALNAIAPAVVITPLMAAALETQEGRDALDQVFPAPLNGPAPVGAPAALLAWLLSTENTHVTGQVLFIDGGAESSMRAPRF